jgi:hypothetical protein
LLHRLVVGQRFGKGLAARLHHGIVQAAAQLVYLLGK